MSYHFLILDDSITARAYTKRVIRLAGYSGGAIHEAANGREALEVLASHRVNLVLAELNLAGASGADVIGRILSEPDTRSVPVVVVATNPEMRQIERLRRAGARGFLRKPITPEALRDAVTRILEPTHV